MKSKFILWAWCTIGNKKAYPVYYAEPIVKGVETTVLGFKEAKRFDRRMDAEKIKKRSRTAWIVDTDQIK